MNLSPNQIRANARQFSLDWQGAIKENAESQTFWNEFFAVFGINRRKIGGLFEMPIKKKSGTQGRIDVFWKKRLLCEQKSRGEDLDKAIEQALGYLQSLDQYHSDDFPRYVIVCDFQTLKLLDTHTQDSRQIQVADLADHIELFGFMSGYEVEFRAVQEATNIKAAEKMGRLHDELERNGYDGHPLKVMLIRLLFCMFAEDTGIFNRYQFEDLISKRTREDGSDLAGWLNQLFDTLNRLHDKRFKNLDEQLDAFAYINGELFAETMPPAAFDAPMRKELIAACQMDWRTISPEIFGALFQSVMNKNERRNLGAHYTNEENILKVVSSLFMDELRAEFAQIQAKKQANVRASSLHSFHDKISRLTFLDPACGCGNFLIVAYRELRLLELAVIEQLQKDDQQLVMDVGLLIRCQVSQFYGIEIEEFPAQIARVAMWLVDHQMNMEVSRRFGMHYARIPLKQSAHIENANALQVEWPVTDFILGNPPFLGKTYQNKNQKDDLAKVCMGIPSAGNLDFVAAWYIKAVQTLNAQRSTLNAQRSTLNATA
jgi:type I restriction-modification system DNA methylase subunit